MPASDPIPPHHGGNGPDAASTGGARPAPLPAAPRPAPTGRLAVGLLVLALDVWLAGLAALLLVLAAIGHPFPWVDPPASGGPAPTQRSEHAPLLIAAATAAVLGVSALVLGLRGRRAAAAVQGVLLTVLLVTVLALWAARPGPPAVGPVPAPHTYCHSGGSCTACDADGSCREVPPN
ncbi:hypothetical protein [Kitasatospora sp. NPDC094015]|uniref:hypothetical protein n=1 Tax=Kitasatospora sp. NPDC094015 TaxID=3155205 RepID=UPI00332F02FC